MEDWLSIVDKYQNSVLQLICVRGHYNPFRPQNTPDDRRASGSGFIVDINKGLLVTNAHVVSNAISISGRMMAFGERDFSVRILSICREKDLAICQINNEGIQIILDKFNTDINMTFGDNMLLRETDPVITIGYPLGQKIVKFTTGVVSGFHANSDLTDEQPTILLSDEEEPSYIQITAPINPGNSGGPLLNRKGEVVGINSAGIMFSQNISYAIGTRTLLGIYDNLTLPLYNAEYLPPHIVIPPKYAFEYNRASDDLLKLSCNSTAQGVYIKKVYPDSVFDTLKEGDIVTQIIYEDVYLDNPSAFDVINRTASKGKTVIASLDKFGDLTLDSTTSQRKLSIKELFDIIPMDKRVAISICRCTDDRCGMYVINTIFKYVPSSIRRFLYPRITPYKYEIVAGLSIGELTLNHIEDGDNLDEYSKGKKRYQPVLVVNQVFPDTTAYHVRTFKEGSIIKEFNSVKVTNIDELQDAILNSGDYITIVSKEKDKLVVSKERVIEEDTYTLEQFGFDKLNKYILK